ncbi:hypothetical protein BUALT_Bualt01G0172100 [Buddleja alternifolia]|uniref:Disease resistance protein RPM1 n=1 Tax=Buddleja alternifolia TaxID=168488 RepID=A0AAV6YI99_9LAMI|nr:hypothetical protein BUALT_Bualt01G0172100 [Buddleja alternifolia]
MAEPAVQFLLEKLSTLMVENVKLIKDVKHEIEYMRDELERMTAFLRVADAAEDNNPQLKVWVKQVRDVAHEAEDIIDEFMLHVPNTNGCCPDFVHRLIFCLKNLNSHYEIASQIQNINSRIKKIDEGHKRYDANLNVPNQGPSSSDEIDRRGDALLLEEDELVGIEHPKEEVVAWIVEGDSRLKVVAVVGMGGLGKTTLVKKVFDDDVVKKHFHNYAWITVSHSFKMGELLKDMIHQLFDQMKIPVPEAMSTMNRDRLKATIKDFLKQRRYLLVFDDVWSIEAWEAIKYVFPNEDQGSRVILTTRSMDVASSCSAETKGYVYELNPLSKEESWILFCQKAFHGNSCPEHLSDICENILRRCGGLPLAIVAISRVLSTKNESNVDDWRMLSDGLGSELEGNDQLESMSKILLLSFNYLPYYLKPCFMYLSSYPEDHSIEHNILVRQWIAEGFVKPKEGRSVEEVAQGYLNELVNRSLLRPLKTNDDGSVKISQIHDLYREIILLKSRDQNFVTTTTESDMVRVRRLSVHGSLGSSEVEKCGSRLCSLMLFNMVEPCSVSSILKLIKTSTMLKVLDLTGIHLEKFPKVIFELFHLKYLCLRNTGIKKLPGSIKKLQKLEMLDLKGTYVTELPVGILKLLNLRQLLVYHHVLDSYMPYNHIVGFKALKGIGCLKFLQKLCIIEISPGSCVLEEIGKMTELRRISITKLRTGDCVGFCSAITNLVKLCSLSVRAVEGDVLNFQYLTSPPPSLQRLYLEGELANFPHWIQSLRSLVKVYIRWSRLSDDPLQYIEDLPNLVHIEFLDAYIGEELCFKAGKFQKLKLLGLDKLESLKSVVIEEGSTPLLEKLIIQRCSLLQSVPVGIERLTNMKVLEFFDMPDEFISPLSPEKSREEYWKVEHIPKVYHIYWRNDGWEVYSLDGSLAHEESAKPGAAIVKTQGQRNWM